MELTWVAASSLLVVGIGYVFVRRAQYSRVAVWVLLCSSLFVLSTRGLLRSREQARPPAESGTKARADGGHTRTDERQPAERRLSLRTRILRRLARLFT